MPVLTTYYPKKLKGVVKCIWCLEVPANNGSPYVETILPDGHHEIIFQLHAGDAKRSDDGRVWLREPSAFLAGQNQASYHLELQEKSFLYGIRLHPHAFTRIFNFPAYEATDTILPLQDIATTTSLTDCISDDSSATIRLLEKAMETHTGKMTQRSKRRDFSAIIGLILKEHGHINIKTLANEANMSLRNFEEVFKEEIGITAKCFCRIIKLNHFILFRQNNPEKSLTECAYEANFFDQAHAIHTFQSIAQCAPRDFFKHDNLINYQFIQL